MESSRLSLRLALATGLALLLAAAPTAHGEPATEPVRGVVISCQTWGREWGTDEMVDAMREVKALGANWVQIHPYAGVDPEGGLHLRRWQPGAPPPEWLTRPIAEAHRLGLKICITPHVAPWRAGWSWRGDIHFDTAAQWDRFFADYRIWITELASICRDADGFVVGSELDQTTRSHEDDWRDIIRLVRAETDAPLAYAANWPDYQKVPFWDALDVIAISAYFPLTTDAAPPTTAELDRAWTRIRHDVLTYARAQYRQVVFMELGYDTGLNAAREPWRDGDGQPGGAILQARCLDRALAAVAVPDDDLVGTFLWKWFPGDPRGENFLVSEPHMRAIVARHWAPESTAPPTPPAP